jgi:tRNA threonylcarbamoyladenosine biosynthesis protein TsaB
MRLLAIEASTPTASCALWTDGVVSERVCAADRNSSETLLPAIMGLLAEHQLGLAQLDGIAFGAGPGSFTGLRVAAGITQGLAFPFDLPVAPIETLAAVAWASGAERALAMLDARMQEIYAASYQRQGGRLRRLGELQVARPESLLLPDTAAGWTVCGNAWLAYPALAGRLQGWSLMAASLPMASAIAELGSHVFADGGALAADFAQPVYVRDKVAFTTAERLAKGGKA